MSKSKIEWTDETWNPVTGCTRVSAGCDNCYAVTMTKRLAAMGLTKYEGLINEGKNHFNGVVKCHPETLEIPLKWRKPRRVFVNSMSDLFHPGIPFEFIDKVFAVMALAKDHTFQVLTKRPDRMAEYLHDQYTRDRVRHEQWTHGIGTVNVENDVTIQGNWPLKNVWLGTSVEDQATAKERIPHLVQTPAVVKFLSMEPLLGPVSLRWLAVWTNQVYSAQHPDHNKKGTNHLDGLREIDWVIVGGESGHNSRYMHPAWVRTIRDQCIEAGVPFFFKQWGGFRYAERKPFQGPAGMGHSDYWYVDDGSYAGYPASLGLGMIEVDKPASVVVDGEPFPELICWPVPKKNSDRRVDCREWNYFPEATHV